MPYSLMLDSSNDNGIYKMFPTMVRIFDETFSEIMEGRDTSTADVMCKSVDNILTKNDIR